MTLFTFLMVGLISGFVAAKIVKGHGFGVFPDILVGVLGAVIGGEILSSFGVATYGLSEAIAASTLGAIALLVVVNLLQPRFGGRRSV